VAERDERASEIERKAEQIGKPSLADFTVAMVVGTFSIGKSLGEFLMNDPAIRAMGRLGIKELSNAADLSRDFVSVSQGAHEYGTLGSITPGQVHEQIELNRGHDDGMRRSR
jgi:hypothetical protein